VPRDIQAAHNCWEDDSVPFVSTTTKGQRFLDLDLERACLDDCNFLFKHHLMPPTYW
jgi:hypothetical protein